MRKRLSNHSEVAHVWAHQGQTEGYSGNITFNGNIIYSYGWWAMAAHLDDNTVAIRLDNYSVSTAKHLSIVQSAISHKNIIECYDPELAKDGVHSRNLTEYTNRIKDIIDKQLKARTKDYRYDLQQLRLNYKAYCEFFELEIDDELIRNSDELQAKLNYIHKYHLKRIAKHEERQRKEQERRAKAFELKHGMSIDQQWDAWRNGKLELGDLENTWGQKITRLRLHKGHMETSKGLKFPMKEVLRFAIALLNNPMQLEGERLSRYRIDKVAPGDYIQAGCHIIRWDEATSTAKQLIEQVKLANKLTKQA